MASGNMKDIKRRIKSVQSTMQITKAMELVASSKMRHAKERALGARPYFNALYQTITHLAGATRGSESVYTRPRDVKHSLYIVIAGDRGLAGGYNANLFKLAAAEMQGKQAQVITIGKKAQEHYAKRPVTVAADYPGIAETMRISDTHPIVEDMLKGYAKAHSDIVTPTDNPRVFKTAQPVREGKVGIVTGGGSGHKPAFIGYVGRNMVDAVAVGEIFSSPTAVAFYDAIRAADHGNGVACLYGNYAGDNMNVKMAMEMAEDDDIEVKIVVANDDVASAPKENREKRRGNAAAPGKSGFIPLLCRS